VPTEVEAAESLEDMFARRAREDHIDAVLGPYSAPSPEQVAAVTEWAAQLDAAVDREWLELFIDGRPIMLDRLADLTDPNLAWGQCHEVSSIMEEWCQFAAQDMPVHSAVVVQGMTRRVGTLQAHYALAVALEEGDAPVIVDLTHSQINAAAPFPLVAAPADWIEAIHTVHPVR